MAVQGCPEGLLLPGKLLSVIAGEHCSVCHNLALLGPTSSRKHQPGCWALGVDEQEDEGKDQGKGNREDEGRH